MKLSLLKSSLLRWLVTVTFLLCQMPLAPVLAGVLARADGGHEVLISQSDSCTLITLHHRANDSHRFNRGVDQVLNISCEEQPDHQLRCSIGPANRVDENNRVVKQVETFAAETDCSEDRCFYPVVFLVRVTIQLPRSEIVCESVCRGLRETILMV